MPITATDNQDDILITKVRQELEKICPFLRTIHYIPIIQGDHVDTSLCDKFPKEKLDPCQGSIAFLSFHETTGEFELWVKNIFFPKLYFHAYLRFTEDGEGFCPVFAAKGRTQHPLIRPRIGGNIYDVHCDGYDVHISSRFHEDNEDFKLVVPITKEDVSTAFQEHHDEDEDMDLASFFMLKKKMGLYG